MAVTLGSTGITFPDATTQTTAASGGGAPQATFTAAAAITAGNVVQFTTGSSVTPISGAVYTQAVTGGAPTATTPAASSQNDQIGVAFDPNTAGSFISFTYTGGVIALAAGTLVNNTTTMGSVLSVSVGAGDLFFYQAKIMFDPVTAGKCMLIALDVNASNAVKAWIFTVSGNTITLRSTTTLTSGTSTPVAWSYYGQDTFVYAITDAGGTNKTYACSISTYTITQGTATTIATNPPSSGTTNWHVDMDYNRLVSNQLVFAFRNNSTTYPTAVVFNVTPATKVITAGSQVTIVSVTTTGLSVAWDLLVSTRFALASFNTAGNTLSLNGGITSGTTITTAAQWHNFTGGFQTGPYGVKVAFSTTGSGSANSSVVGFYASAAQGSNCCGTYRQPWFNSTVLTGSGTPTVSWGTYLDVGGRIYGGTQFSRKIGGMAQIPNQIGKFPLMRIGTSDHPWLYFGQAGYTNTNLDSTKIIGIADASASAAASVLVNVLGGTDTHQTSLTANSTYYVSATGALTTTSTAPNVKIGRATSATSILIQGLTI